MRHETSQDATMRGIVLMLVALVVFAIMDASVKGLHDQGFGTMQIVFFRSLFGLVPLSVLIVRGGGLRALRTRRPFGHVVRAAVSALAMAGFFYAFGNMPLADAYAIYFAAPLFLTALSAFLMREHVGPRRWAAVAVGFAGVMVMLRPTGDVLSFAALVCLGATVLYSIGIIFVRSLSRTETNAAIIFYMSATCAVIGAVLMLPEWRTPSLPQLLALIGTGLLGGVAQLLLTQSLRLAPVSTLAPFEYTSMLWAVGLGYLFWGHVPGWSVWVGGAVVVASGIYIVHREAKLARNARVATDAALSSEGRAAQSP